MKRSYLEKVYFKKQTTQSLERHKKQNTIAVDCMKKREQIIAFFNSLNTSFVNDNKLFSKTVKPLFGLNTSFVNDNELFWKTVKPFF